MIKSKMTQILFRILGVSIMLLALLVANIPVETQAEQSKDGSVIYNDKGEVTEITISSGELKFPDAVTSISKDVIIPTGAAFSSIVLSKNMENLDKDMLADPTKAEYINIFDNPTVTSIRVTAENKKYSTDLNGNLYNKDKTELLKVPLGRKDSIELPNTVTAVRARAMYGSLSQEITIPKTVKKLSADTISDGVSSSGFTMYVNVLGQDTTIEAGAIKAMNRGNEIIVQSAQKSTAERYSEEYQSGIPTEAEGKLSFKAVNLKYDLTYNDGRSNKTDAEQINITLSNELKADYTFNVSDSTGSNLSKLLQIGSRATAKYYDLSLVDDKGQAVTNFGTASITLPLDSSWDAKRIKVFSIKNNALESLLSNVRSVNGVNVVNFQTTHFSEFVVINDPDNDSGASLNNNTDANNNNANNNNANNNTNTNTNTDNNNANTNTNTDTNNQTQNPNSNNTTTPSGDSNTVSQPSANNTPTTNTSGTTTGTTTGTTSGTRTGRVDMPRTGDWLGSREWIVVLMMLTGIVLVALSVPIKTRKER